jgi:hypothetical protein
MPPADDEPALAADDDGDAEPVVEFINSSC